MTSSSSLSKETFDVDGLKLHFRYATEDDKENLYVWEMESIDTSLVNNEEVQKLVRKDVEENLKNTKMLMDDDKTIGMFSSVYVNQYRLIGIYIISEYRGRGIGTKILKSEMEKYGKIKLCCAYSNTRAYKLYISLGFKVIEKDDASKLYVMSYDKDNQKSSPSEM